MSEGRSIKASACFFQIENIAKKEKLLVKQAVIPIFNKGANIKCEIIISLLVAISIQ